jgi:hypothetical protein
MTIPTPDGDGALPLPGDEKEKSEEAKRSGQGADTALEALIRKRQAEPTPADLSDLGCQDDPMPPQPPAVPAGAAGATPA